MNILEKLKFYCETQNPVGALMRKWQIVRTLTKFQTAKRQSYLVKVRMVEHLLCTLELFERIERFARMERTSGTVVSAEEALLEKTVWVLSHVK